MSATTRWPSFCMCLGCGIAVCLIGCEPPKVPTTGGLVSTRQGESQTLPATAPADMTIPASGAAADQTASPPAQSPQEIPPAAGSPLPGDPALSTAAGSPPAASTPIAANPGLIPVDQIGSAGAKSAPGQGGAAQGQGTPQPGPRSTSTNVVPSGTPPIHLSAGIAVPQSLPTGTQMGISVDYAIRGALNRSSRYVLVISSEGGGSVEAEVKLATSGTFQDFVPKLRPEDRPFNCRIDEVTPGGRRIRASNVAPLQTNY